MNQSYLFMKQLIPCFKIRSTLSFIFSWIGNEKNVNDEFPSIIKWFGKSKSGKGSHTSAGRQKMLQFTSKIH